MAVATMPSGLTSGGSWPLALVTTHLIDKSTPSTSLIAALRNFSFLFHIHQSADSIRLKTQNQFTAAHFQRFAGIEQRFDAGMIGLDQRTDVAPGLDHIRKTNQRLLPFSEPLVFCPNIFFGCTFVQALLAQPADSVVSLAGFFSGCGFLHRWLALFWPLPASLLA